MAEDKTEIDPFDISFATQENPQPKKRSPKLLWDKIVNNFKPNDYDEREVPLEEVMTPQQFADYKREQEELKNKYADEEEIDVPEVETHVEDLPENNENEKELIVEHPENQEEVNAPSAEELNEGAEQTPQEELPDELDKTQAEQILGEEIKEPSKDEGGDKTLTPNEKQDADMNEMRALAQDDLKDFKYDTNMDKWTPKQKQDAIKAWREKQKAKQDAEEEVQEPPKEEKPTMTKEEALAEARMLAQDDLEGVDIDPNLWSQFSNKEKLDFIKMLQDKDKTPVTNVDEDTTNNYEAYRHYPVALRVAEDVLKGADNIANRAATDARKNLAGGEGVNGAVARSTIPHYDYRSFFK